VFNVSSLFLDDGEIAPTIKVFVFYVNDSCNNLVNFDYLKIALLVFVPFEREFITFPKVVRDKFIFFNYYK
jgi:hypothetical protein